MGDITTTQVFSDGEVGITATKLNNIIAQATIQPSFVTGKPSSSTLDPTDQMLEVKSGGTYATITGSQLISSVGTGLNPQIWSTRLRSFNAAANAGFEVDQANVNATVTSPANGARLADRWWLAKVGTMNANTQVVAAGAQTGIVIPGTNFYITRNFLRTTLTAQETSLGTSDQLGIYQNIEGPYFREILGDVFSLSVLVRCSVPLKFGINLRDSPGTQSISALGTIGTANVWTLVTVPNLPVCPSGNFTGAAGAVGQVLRITLAAGGSLIGGTNNVWSSGGTFVGAVGQDNFAAQPITTTTFDIAYIQLEPGANATTLMDVPFYRAHDEALRYYCKSFDYDTLPGTVTAIGCGDLMQQSTTTCLGTFRYPKAMAKIPTLTAYNFGTGAANSIRFSNGTDYAVSNFLNAGKAGFQGITTATLPAVTAGASARLQFTADTGW